MNASVAAFHPVRLSDGRCTANILSTFRSDYDSGMPGSFNPASYDSSPQDIEHGPFSRPLTPNRSESRSDYSSGMPGSFTPTSYESSPPFNEPGPFARPPAPNRSESRSDYSSGMPGSFTPPSYESSPQDNEHGPFSRPRKTPFTTPTRSDYISSLGGGSHAPSPPPQDSEGDFFSRSRNTPFATPNRSDYISSLGGGSNTPSPPPQDDEPNPFFSSPKSSRASPIIPKAPVESFASSTPSGPGLGSYLDALGSSSNRITGPGISTYLDTVPRNVPEIGGVGLSSYSNSIPASNVAGGPGLSTYTDALSGRSAPHDTSIGGDCMDANSIASLGTTSNAASSRRPIVGGNWKCNPASALELSDLVRNFDGCAQYLDKCDVYVCPSNLHVSLVKDSFAPGISVAPQNCNFGGCGAYTGEMAVDQIKDLGMKTVLIGHSERRGEFGLPTPAESNHLLATKLQYILDQGLNCIFCIGEPLPVREQGINAVLNECISQLQDIVPILRALQDKSRVVIAYEPVWAIGTGVTATPEQAQETHAAIRDWLEQAVDSYTASQIRIQYGGSANAQNAPELAACPDIDGFLVGGASLKPDIVDIVASIAAKSHVY